MYVARRLRVLGLKTLGAYYRTEWWITLRRARLAGAVCTECGSRQNLRLHHLTYARLGAELVADLAVLCDGCHRTEHGLPPRRAPRKRKRA